MHLPSTMSTSVLKNEHFPFSFYMSCSRSHFIFPSKREKKCSNEQKEKDHDAVLPTSQRESDRKKERKNEKKRMITCSMVTNNE